MPMNAASILKLLVDMNLSPDWVPFLQQNGYDAVHWSKIGATSAPDTEIMAYAAAHGFVVFTNDLDFGTLLIARGLPGPSIIQARAQDLMPRGIGATLLRALEATHAELEAGALVTVEPSRNRIRMLRV